MPIEPRREVGDDGIKIVIDTERSVVVEDICPPCSELEQSSSQRYQDAYPNGSNGDGSDEIYYYFSECACGGPVSRIDGSPTATDALYTLNAAVGLVACRLCDCDVDDGGSITALDALTILNAAVGTPVTLTCPE